MASFQVTATWGMFSLLHKAIEEQLGFNKEATITLNLEINTKLRKQKIDLWVPVGYWTQQNYDKKKMLTRI